MVKECPRAIRKSTCSVASAEASTAVIGQLWLTCKRNLEVVRLLRFLSESALSKSLLR